MIPVVRGINRGFGGESDVLWWSLALGADLGGNLTVIAPSANVLVANLAERRGQRIRFRFLVTVGTTTVAMGYLWRRYLI